MEKYISNQSVSNFSSIPLLKPETDLSKTQIKQN